MEIIVTWYVIYPNHVRTIHVTLDQYNKKESVMIETGYKQIKRSYCLSFLWKKS